MTRSSSASWWPRGRSSSTRLRLQARWGVQAKVPDKMPDYPMINRNQNDQAPIQPAPKLSMEEMLRDVANANTYCCSMEAQRVGST